MAYYDHIAIQWHKATGNAGCAFKKLILNERLLQKIPAIQDRAILELGAGNGYFLPLVLGRFSDQTPSGVTVTDISARLLEIARRHFRVSQAGYQVLDVRRPFPLETRGFDLILATMLFNEVDSHDLRNALAECHRVLSEAGRLLITVMHPTYVKSLQKWRLIVRGRAGALTMPGAGALRLPLVIRSHEAYRAALAEAGFHYEEDEAYPTPEVLNVKPGLRSAGKVPRALIFRCWKFAPASDAPVQDATQHVKGEGDVSGPE